MSTFKFEKRVPFCSTKELRDFAETHLEMWSDAERTQEEVHERCTRMLSDAAEGKLKIDGKAVYAKALGGILKEYGAFMSDANSKVKETSPYA